MLCIDTALFLKSPSSGLKSAIWSSCCEVDGLALLFISAKGKNHPRSLIKKAILCINFHLLEAKVYNCFIVAKNLSVHTNLTAEK